MSSLLQAVVSCTLVAALGAVQRAAPAQTYKAIGEYKLSGKSAKGLAVDSDGRRIFVAGSDGVTVLNADSGAVVGKLESLKDAQDILLIPEMKGDDKAPSTRGYAADSSGHVVAFSLADMKPLATIKLDSAGPAQLCYDNDEKTVEEVSASGFLATIDAEANKVVTSGKIATGGGQIVCGNMGHVYVADPAANVVHVLNHDTLRNEGDYTMKTGRQPTGLALDTKGRRLFVTCEDGTIEIIDTDAGFTFIELQGGKGVAHETFAWLPQGKGQWKAAAFVAQEDGTLSGIRMNAYINYSMGGQYKLTPGLGAVAYDEKTHHLFLTSMSSGSPVVVVAGY
jgi:DNA-binding beta-propeller fold protein YncE